MAVSSKFFGDKIDMLCAMGAKIYVCPANVSADDPRSTASKDWGDLIPSATDFDTIDRFVKVSDEASAHTAREIAKTKDFFVGYTSGATTQGVKQLAEEGEFDENSKVVIIFLDHGSRYMRKVFSDQGMEEQGFFDIKTEHNSHQIEYKIRKKVNLRIHLFYLHIMLYIPLINLYCL